jgi:hypothetical protein
VRLALARFEAAVGSIRQRGTGESRVGTAVRRATALALVACWGLAACASGAPQVSGPLVRVLFLGNSYTYANDLPATFGKLAAAGGHNVQTGMVANGGETLAQHASASDSMTALYGPHWNYVVLQEQSEIPAISRSRAATMYPAARTLVSKIVSVGAVPVFFMTWAHRDGDPGLGLPDYKSMQIQIGNAYFEIAHELNDPIAPVGYTWWTVHQEHPEMQMWVDDGSHPTQAGTYLAACVFYATIFRQSPEGLSYHGGIATQDAQVLQTAAAHEVLESPDLWGLR